MKVSECMTKKVEVISPHASLREAAQKMAQFDVGSIPVAEEDHLIGMLTDRDIAIRAVSQGKGPDTPVREAMTEEVIFCFEDQEVEDVGQIMAECKVRRLPVVSREQRLTGMITLGDIFRSDVPLRQVKGVLREVSDDSPTNV